MSASSYLSVQEFAALRSVGLNGPTRPQISAAHSEKLLGLRYIAISGGRYQATQAGLYRIANGS